MSSSWPRVALSSDWSGRGPTGAVGRGLGRPGLVVGGLEHAADLVLGAAGDVELEQLALGLLEDGLGGGLLLVDGLEADLGLGEGGLGLLELELGGGQGLGERGGVVGALLAPGRGLEELVVGAGLLADALAGDLALVANLLERGEQLVLAVPPAVEGASRVLGGDGSRRGDDLGREDGLAPVAQVDAGARVAGRELPGQRYAVVTLGAHDPDRGGAVSSRLGRVGHRFSGSRSARAVRGPYRRIVAGS